MRGGKSNIPERQTAGVDLRILLERSLTARGTENRRRRPTSRAALSIERGEQ